MKNALSQMATSLNSVRKKRQGWQKVVSVLAAVVVFGTTYALILPAITMEQDTICGIEEHEHSEKCYETHVKYSMQCISNLSSGTVIHSHNEICYDAEGNLICTLAEFSVHTHSETCFDEVGNMICTLPEIFLHTHEDACYEAGKSLVCTMPEVTVHTHEENCYQTNSKLICTLEETEGHIHEGVCYTVKENLICQDVETQGHMHGDSCYQMSEHLICEVPEKEAHFHADTCYDAEGNVICGLEENMGHAHEENCYESVADLICELEETDGHVHKEDCYESEVCLCCELEEVQPHVHADTCYELESVVICTLAEVEEHKHIEDCYDADGNLICVLPEVIAHSHTDSCYEMENHLVCPLTYVYEHVHNEGCLVMEESEPVLICELPVHIHGDACYAKSETEKSGFLCASGEHVHGESCFGENSTLTCTVPEHMHEASCLTAEVDLNADVETKELWDALVANVEKTGNWPTDVLAIAQTQLDYQESMKNVVYADGELKGYTRYGAWSGNAYGDWDAMFVAFCLDYAGVDEFPVKSDSVDLLTAVKDTKWYHAPEDYTPKSGDVIFFGTVNHADGTTESIRSGLIAEVIQATEESSAQIKTIEGNSDNKVQYVTHEMTDPRIVAYGEMPSGDVRILNYQGTDYNVTVRFGQNAGLAEHVELEVREIVAGTEEYETYYQQSVQTLFGQSAVTTEEELDVSFARFFDISFVADGVKIEPQAPVDIQIRYDEAIEMEEQDSGFAVHFAEDGVEVLDAELSKSDTEQTDTFEFTQDSFSVTGTVVYNAARAADVYATINTNTLDSSGNIAYIVYTKYNDKYYALDGNGKPQEITVNADGTISGNIYNNLLWRFYGTGQIESGFGSIYRIQNAGTSRYMHTYYDNASGYGATTNGNWTSTLVLSGEGDDITFKVKSGDRYSYMENSSSFRVSWSMDNAAQFYIAALPQNTYHVWFDGTHGGIMSLYGSDNTYQAVTAGSTITLPTTWKSPSKYAYKLNGWYDIVSHTYYKAGANVQINQNTVFYADWVAATYDVGQDNEHVVDSLDTNDFITTYVFDYNSLFNAQSLSHLGAISASGHTEYWSMVNSGKVPYNNENTLEFAFLDYDSNGDFSYANGRDNSNTNQFVITPGIIAGVNTVSGGKDLMDILFNPYTSIIGKNYVGTGNYLYQYMDATTDNYDGHDGYYYFHSRLNAASYNQSEKRFYLYDYLERTSDSEKDGGDGEYSDFLPFNSPYVNHQNLTIKTYTDPDTGMPGYQYDAKDNGQGSAYANAGTNYWFGIRSDIEFYLPNDSGTVDEYGNYGNISTKGKHMVFEFHGDDDVWVYVDGVLMLDVGGVHGIEYGEIDFSTGRVITHDANGNEVVKTFEEILGTGKNVEEGTHVMTFYYMERGSSQSNSSIYFNIAPRYDLEITKEDIYTKEALDGTEFTVYTDETCKHEAELWASKAAHEAGEEPISTIKVVNGVASCWGLSAGKTYYIKETKAPEGYYKDEVLGGTLDDIIRITLNNRGTATIETTTLHGPNGEPMDGYAVIEQNVNDTLKIVALVVTNQKDEETTEVRVQKNWDEESVNIPDSITAYLIVDGKRVGRIATLRESNGWSYTWTGLPKYDSNGVEVKYQVEEVLVSGYTTTHVSTEDVVDYVEWVKTDTMGDSITYLLVNAGRALAYNGHAYEWISMETAQSEAGLSAQWTVTTNHYGFRLTNGNGYSIAYTNGRFTASTSTDVSVNEVLYFAGAQLMAQQNDTYYYFGDGGTALEADGLVFTLYKKETITGTLVNIKNIPVMEEEQTFLNVYKEWADGEDHSDDSVIIRLYADGKDTGREMVLNEANQWSGSFEGLPYYQEDGTTVIVYSVVEDKINGFEESYSVPIEVTGKVTTVWRNADSLESGSIFRFVSGTYALGCDADGQLLLKSNDLGDTYQQWKVVAFGSSMKLQNVGSGYYLYYNYKVTTTNNLNSASTIALSGEVLKVGSRYLQIISGEISSSQYENNGTHLAVSKQVQVMGKPGTAITVTNAKAQYNLPQTGGTVPCMYTLGVLLVVITLMCFCGIRYKQRKEVQ